MAHVQIPAFTRGKSQLAPVDLETTRKIAHVRIHVERFIGCVRQKYTILGGILPIDFLMYTTVSETTDDKFNKGGVRMGMGLSGQGGDNDGWVH